MHERSIYGKIEEVYEKTSNTKGDLKGEYVVLLSNKYEEKKQADEICLESKLLDLIIKDCCTLKDAVNKLNSNNKEISKKDIYNASLNLKKLLK